MSEVIEVGDLELIVSDGVLTICLSEWSEEPFTGEVKLSKEESERLSMLITKRGN